MGYGTSGCFGGGLTDCTSCHCSDPVTGFFALKGTVTLPLTPWKDCYHGHKTP